MIPLIADLGLKFNIQESTHPILEKAFKEKEIRKNQYLLKAGQTCDKLYYINKGLFKCYYVLNLKQVCSWFMMEKEFIVSVESYFTNQPSYESIQAIENSLVYFITKKDLNKLIIEIPEISLIYRHYLERYYLLSERRIYSLRMQSAKERYQTLIKQYPEIIKRVSSIDIASYLGISPETLSRVKNKYR